MGGPIKKQDSLWELQTRKATTKATANADSLRERQTRKEADPPFPKG
jgi:hypothetical protein